MGALGGLLAAQHSGAGVCKSCHPSHVSSQSQTAHARSLSRPAQHTFAAKFPGSPGEWAFGAGLQAVTFVSRADRDHHIEHGQSWYARTQSMGLTPGHSGEEGERYRTFDPGAAILRCFQCHSTGPVSVETSGRIQPAEPGVRCEACHGPGAAHAAQPGKRNIGNPGRMTAAEVNSLCGACHRMPAAAGDATDFTNPWNARHQPLYFAESACFLKSGGKLSCLSCHAPHEAQAARGDAKCAECHARVRHRTATAGGSCTGCHMPAVRPMPQLSFANHWIGVYAPGDPLRVRRRR